jgi:integrase
MSKDYIRTPPKGFPQFNFVLPSDPPEVRTLLGNWSPSGAPPTERTGSTIRVSLGTRDPVEGRLKALTWAAELKADIAAIRAKTYVPPEARQAKVLAGQWLADRVVDEPFGGHIARASDDVDGWLAEKGITASPEMLRELRQHAFTLYAKALYSKHVEQRFVGIQEGREAENQWMKRQGFAAPAPSVVITKVEPYLWSELIEDWAKERQLDEREKYNATNKVAKLTALIGHDDVMRLTEAELLKFKDHLLASDLAPKTIKSYLDAVKVLLNFAVKYKRRLAVSPALHVRYKPPKAIKKTRIGYDEDDARKILLAARKEKRPHMRWMPWLLAYTGARLDEVAGAMVVDVQAVDNFHVLAIAPDNREKGSRTKNIQSIRRVPLHPALIEEGFLDYVAGLKRKGPLFPEVPKDKWGLRAGAASKNLGYWLRHKIGITDKRKVAAHSWRHRFKTVARRAGIEEEIHDALTGHEGEGSIGRDYGDYEMATLFEAICRLSNPLTLPQPVARFA